MTQTPPAPEPSAWFVQGHTYRRDITHPETGEKAWVEYRVLNSGDRAVLDDTIAMQFAEEGDRVSPQLKLGTMKRLTVVRAVQAWGLPGNPTEAAISQLHPDVFEAILANVGWGSEPKEDEVPLDGEMPNEGELEQPSVESS